ncbi:MAG: methyl-accepting chemotaxis protein [Methylococcales bacterium]|jgi:methyl-accepting chemotaxis protein|nr:methyl-accepting chemotaxis protein [Methylococcales bacterium]MBT7409312.1 methyl-accepting chemotaxis protein [Methylococcales bacterium]
MLKNSWKLITFIAYSAIMSGIIFIFWQQSNPTENSFLKSSNNASIQLLWQHVLNEKRQKLNRVIDELTLNKQIENLLLNNNSSELKIKLDQIKRVITLISPDINIMISDASDKPVYSSQKGLPLKIKPLIKQEILQASNGQLLQVQLKQIYNRKNLVGNIFAYIDLKKTTDQLNATLTSTDKSGIQGIFWRWPNGDWANKYHSAVPLSLVKGIPVNTDNKTFFHEINSVIYSITQHTILTNTKKPLIQSLLVVEIGPTKLLKGTQWPLYLSIIAFMFTLLAIGIALHGHYDQFKQKQAINKLAIECNKIAETSGLINFNENIPENLTVLSTALDNIASQYKNKTDEIMQLQEPSENLNDFLERSRTLQDAVELVAQGDLQVSINISDDEDELSNLESSIVSMLSSLIDLINKIQQASMQVTSSITQIDESTKEESDRVSQQVIHFKEISENVEDIVGASDKMLLTMNNVDTVIQDMASAAQTGQEALSLMDQSMRSMINATESIHAKLAVISEKTSNINMVVTTITKIADHTNLLSLNAAIEAEKAGKYGMGFSVVADEIRRLANQTAIANFDIEKMVADMIESVAEGVHEMNIFSEEVSSGVKNIEQVSSQFAIIIEQVSSFSWFTEIHEDMESQSDSTKQISTAIFQLAKYIQQTKKSFDKTKETVLDLEDATRILTEVVTQFKVEDKGVEWL